MRDRQPKMWWEFRPKTVSRSSDVVCLSLCWKILQEHLKLVQDRFLPHPYQFISHCSSQHWTLHSRSADSIRPQSTNVCVWWHTNTATRQQCNTPTLQHANTATRQHCNTPTLQHANTATRQQCNTPTLQHVNLQLAAHI